MEEVKTPDINPEVDNKQPETKVDFEAYIKQLNDNFEKLFQNFNVTPKTEVVEPTVEIVEPTEQTEPREEADFDTYCYNHFDKRSDK